MKNLKNLISQGATVVDVRTSGEYGDGHIQNSKNIPLNEIPARISEISTLGSPIILCCASGGRSAQAFMYLSGKGIDCIDAGSWLNLNFSN